MSYTFFILSSLALLVVTFSQSGNAWISPDWVKTTIISDVLPGRNKSPQQQCRDRKSFCDTTVYKVDDPAEICKELKCASRRGDTPMAEKTGPALDGTWCGYHKICFQGSCIEDKDPRENPLKIVDSDFCEE